QSFDPLYGGFGPAPKFPPTGQLELLMRLFHREGELDYGVMVSRTLHKMAQGGIYDHLGGGFARYSTDAAWQIPHFEKMLYDNALLALNYMDAFLVLKDPFFLQIAEETLMWVITDLQSLDGGFYSSRDADSEGVEGKFYLWSWDEIKESLSYDEFELVNRILDLHPQGNFNGANILRMKASWEDLATQIGWSVEKLQMHWQPIKEKLRLIRSHRIPPARDEMILSDWNGLAIAALSRAYRLTGKDLYLNSAHTAAQFIFHQLWRAAEGLTEPKSAVPILYHRWWKGNAGIRGMLDDYAFMMLGLVELYFADFDPQWIKWCCELSQSLETWLAVETYPNSKLNASGGFYNSPNEDLGIIRFYNAYDSSVPSGNAIAGIVFWILWQLTGKIQYRHRAEAIAESFSGNLADNPTAHLKLAILIDHITQPTYQIVLALPNNEPLKNFLRIINSKYLPHVVKAVRCFDSLGNYPATSDEIIELLKGKESINHNPTLYICRDFVCEAPIIGITAIENALSAL
ncbi:MAG: thioredoxin domain-containing protein, partial [bacterium]